MICTYHYNDMSISLHLHLCTYHYITTSVHIITSPPLYISLHHHLCTYHYITTSVHIITSPPLYISLHHHLCTYHYITTSVHIITSPPLYISLHHHLCAYHYITTTSDGMGRRVIDGMGRSVIDGMGRSVKRKGMEEREEKGEKRELLREHTLVFIYMYQVMVYVFLLSHLLLLYTVVSHASHTSHPSVEIICWAASIGASVHDVAAFDG